MSAHAAAIETLTDRLRGFVRDPSCKLLQVIVSADLRKGALATAMAAEHAPENQSSFVGFAEPHLSAAPGWTARANTGRALHDARRDDADPPIAELPPAPTAADGLVAFAEQTWQLLETRPPGSEGLVVVLAPKQVDSSKAWSADVARLVFGRSLADVRFIVIDVHTGTVGDIVDKLGEQGWVHETHVPDGAAVEELSDKLGGKPGAAPTDATPPPRPGDSDGEMSPESQRRAMVGTKAVAAALAMGAGDAAAAVTAQREARDLCRAAGWQSEAVQMELVLGGHLMSAGQPRAAEDSFSRALTDARTADNPGKVATAGFSLGATRMARGERHTALVAYAEAAVAAEKSGDAALAIEGNRLAGQAAADIRMEPQAITFLTRAVKLAEVADPAVVPLTSAPHAARGLAALCRKRKLNARAKEFEAQAQVFETPSAPAPPQPAAPELPEEIAEQTLLQPIEELLPAAASAPSEPADSVEPPTQRDPIFADADDPGLVSLPGARVPQDGSVAAPTGPADFDASIPPPDLLAPAPPEPLSPVAADLQPPALVAGDSTLAHSAPPPLLGAVATPADFGEGTSMLTLDEIANLHWGDAAEANAPAGEGSRPWTPEEIQTLQKAVNEVLEPEATTMLSSDELSALRGDRPPDPRPVRAPRPKFVDDGEIKGLEAIPEAPPTSTPAKPRSGDAFNPDEVTILSIDEITALRDRFAKRDDQDPSDS